MSAPGTKIVTDYHSSGTPSETVTKYYVSQQMVYVVVLNKYMNYHSRCMNMQNKLTIIAPPGWDTDGTNEDREEEAE